MVLGINQAVYWIDQNVITRGGINWNDRSVETSGQNFVLRVFFAEDFTVLQENVFDF